MDKYAIASKLRGTALEFGQPVPTTAVIVGPDDMPDTVCGYQYVYVPTMAETTLGNVPHRLARIFEDFPEQNK